MGIEEIKNGIQNKICELELELEKAKRYYRSTVMGQLIACNEILGMINIIEKKDNTKGEILNE